MEAAAEGGSRAECRGLVPAAGKEGLEPALWKLPSGRVWPLHRPVERESAGKGCAGTLTACPGCPAFPGKPISPGKPWEGNHTGSVSLASLGLQRRTHLGGTGRP